MTIHDTSADRRGISFWLGLLAGSGLMAYGIVGMLGASAATQPQNLTGFLLGAAIVHDAVIAPTVIVLGWLVTRVVPPIARVPVWFGLAASGLLIAFTWPLVRGWGRRSANPSLLPFDYGRNVVIGVAVIWVVALAEIVRRLVVHRKAA
jgi:hypothetical protein